ncbi:T-complex protein 11-like X-linked protein 1 [Rhynchocyon petersi]
MTNAFWSLLKEQLSSTPPELTCALELLKGIKESHLRNEIEETLDMDVLKQEAEDGALDVPHLSHFILNLMILLCAPARKQTIQKLKSITDPVHLLRGILPVLGQMKMDTVNYIIRSLRPYLQECSIKYEQDKFQELLNKQPRGLAGGVSIRTAISLRPPSLRPRRECFVPHSCAAPARFGAAAQGRHLLLAI